MTDKFTEHNNGMRYTLYVENNTNNCTREIAHWELETENKTMGVRSRPRDTETPTNDIVPIIHCALRNAGPLVAIKLICVALRFRISIK